MNLIIRRLQWDLAVGSQSVGGRRPLSRSRSYTSRERGGRSFSVSGFSYRTEAWGRVVLVYTDISNTSGSVFNLQYSPAHHSHSRSDPSKPMRHGSFSLFRDYR